MKIILKTKKTLAFFAFYLMSVFTPLQAQAAKVTDAYREELKFIAEKYKIENPVSFSKMITVDQGGVTESVIIFYSVKGEMLEKKVYARVIKENETIDPYSTFNKDAVDKAINAQLRFAGSDIGVAVIKDREHSLNNSENVYTISEKELEFQNWGNTVFINRQAVGVVFFNKVDSNQTCLFKPLVKNATGFTGNIKDKCFEEQFYIIPLEWWRTTFMNEPNHKKIEFIKQNYKYTE